MTQREFNMLLAFQPNVSGLSLREIVAQLFEAEFRDEDGELARVYFKELREEFVTEKG